MPKNAVTIYSDLELTPRPEEIPTRLMIAGDDGEGNSGEIKKIESKEDIPDYGEDSDLEDALKAAFDEGLNEVWVYEVEYETSYPDDLDLDVIENDYVKAEEYGITEIAYAGLDAVNDSTLMIDEDKTLVSLAKDINAIHISETTEVVDSISIDLDLQDRGHFVFAHDYEDSILGNAAAAVTKVYPNDKLMWKGIDTLDENTEYSRKDIEAIEDEYVNAITEVQEDIVFSNGYSTTDDEGYKWVDVTRTEFYLIDRLKERLNRLFKNRNLPYNSNGISTIETRIDSTLRTFRGENLIEYYEVYTPTLEEIDVEDRNNRILRDIEIIVGLPGHIQEIEIDLILEL